MTHAVLNEIFSSYQGEGAFMGRPQVFVRFQGCSQRCRWCDTQAALPSKRSIFRVEKTPQSMIFEDYPNPVTPQQLNTFLSRFSDRFLSLTGGEPLDQIDFLETWLPTLHPDYEILLETAGTHPHLLERILSHIHIVSMDIKLPSSTGEKSHWEEHRAFLEKSLKKKLYIKCVVTEDTHDDDLFQLSSLIREVRSNIPVYIQPASPTPSFNDSPGQKSLIRQMNLLKKEIPRIFLIPQLHKTMGLL